MTSFGQQATHIPSRAMTNIISLKHDSYIIIKYFICTTFDPHKNVKPVEKSYLSDDERNAPAFHLMM